MNQPKNIGGKEYAIVLIANLIYILVCYFLMQLFTI